jgi:hypothetical protein
MFPQTTQTSVGRSYDAAGWASGIAAADNAHLHSHPRLASGRADAHR